MINTGNIKPPIASSSGAGLANPVSGVSTDFIGGDNASHAFPAVTPAAHAPTHEAGGSDTIPVDTLAAPTDITTLNVSTAAHGLCPKTPNNIWNILNGKAVWAEPSAGYVSRYIYQHHCMAPLSASEVSAVSGTGASIQVVSGNPGRPGLYYYTGPTTAAGYVSRNSNSTPEFDLSHFNKIGFRAVIRTGGTLFSGATGATTYGQTVIGFTDTLNIIPGGTQNTVLWRSEVSTTPNWQLLLGKAGAFTGTNSTVAVSANQWYDLRLYFDLNGVVARCGIWNGSATPTILAGGPFLTNMPTTTPMYWTVSIINGGAGTTSTNLYLDLIEVVGEYTTTPGSYIGDQLVLSP